MTITSISASARLASAGADTTPAVSSARVSTSAAAAPSSDDAFKVKSPPRFPWLSRLADELQSNSTQGASFPSAPVLGDHLDKSA